MIQKILIFGGSGFIGRALANYWRNAGLGVVTPSHSEAPLESREAVERAVAEAAPDAVVNLAAQSSPTHGGDRALYELNSFGHLRVLESVERVASGARVLLASTANVYGISARRPLNETDAPAPVNHYGVSKLMAEQFNRLFADRLSVGATRSFNCIGRDQKPSLVVSKLVGAFRQRLPRIELGNLTVERDYVDIRDACAMWDAVLRSPNLPPVVNFGVGEATPLLGIVALLEELTGHRLEVVSSPALVRPVDITYQRADTAILTGLEFVRRYELSDTLSWMLDDSGEGE